MTYSLPVPPDRPLRADARRNFDALLAAAREAFAELGAKAPLEEIARRAGVGIGTLYRNFPTRQVLFDAVYVHEVEVLCDSAEQVRDLGPWESLERWLRDFVTFIGNKRAFTEEMARESPVVLECRKAIYAAGGPLLDRAQRAGAVRSDVGIDDVLRLLTGIALLDFPGGGPQIDAVAGVALDGLRYPPALGRP
ncbi:TetR/AcrR family transcriptional regulator [Streptomyces sp. NBC_01476]|uniref:TetR/AcrR family transcriptional regulator n=1 Tax=Streptomyces sp. NBC_01476 TaxID=2903881 RepID=UPI002E37C3D4|nr:TetR/AcrR family transcriptional regulator [Streptomyces sp. NBC_01476]